MQLSLLRYAVTLAAVTFSMVHAAIVTEDQVATTSSGHLRGLLDKLTSSEGSLAPVEEIAATWQQGKEVDVFQLAPIKKIVGGEAIVVFLDKQTTSVAESAVVSFEVKSSAKCVVSVCGLQRNWYLGSSEQCFDLRIAPTSTDQNENGLIRDVTAAYSSDRPVATKLYLKFDATKIDGSSCEYEIISGTKIVKEEPTPSVDVDEIATTA